MVSPEQKGSDEVKRRLAVGVGAAVLALLVLSQALLPGITGGRIEDRLTEEGGSADVSVSAFPALRLVFGDGDSLEATGSGLDLQPKEDDPLVFESLDGFDQVDLDLDDLRAGPFAVESFELTRDGSGPYHLDSQATVSGAELIDYGAAQAGLPSGPLLRFLAGQLPLAGRKVPIALDMELESEDGRVRVVSGGGTVAGIPTGPLAEVLTSLILVRI